MLELFSKAKLYVAQDAHCVLPLLTLYGCLWLTVVHMFTPHRLPESRGFIVELCNALLER